MIPWLREKEPQPFVEIHPDTARQYSIYDGEWVYIKNDMGRVKRKARVTPVVKPGQICTCHGWWMPEMKGPEPDLFGCWDDQINQLIPGPNTVHPDSAGPVQDHPGRARKDEIGGAS